MVTNAPVLAFYDTQKPLVLENDASNAGLGSALFQEGKPIAYASRTLSDTEKRYAPIEKEMLAVVIGLEKHHHYTFGRPVVVYTDHKPLVSIVSKPLARAPRRLQHLLLRARAYDFTLMHKPGKTMVISDTLSRAPVVAADNQQVTVMNNLTFCPVSIARLDEIRAATRADEALRLLMDTVMQGWPNARHSVDPQVAPYYHFRDELTVQDGIVLRGERIVIPRAMRTDIKNRLHAGHMGINSCLRRARELVYWPGMSNEIRQFVETCDVCATYGDRQPVEPLVLHPVPNRAWEKVGTDLFTIHDKNYLVTVDYFSGFTELDYLPDTTSETVIGKLKYHFARYGIPNTVISDGGPQYASHAFRAFAKSWDFAHEITSPGNSRANGAAEAAVKRVKNVLRKCKAARDDPYLGILEMRNVPSETSGHSPAQLLLGRRVRTLVPVTHRLLQHHDDNVRQAMENKKHVLAQRDAARHSTPPLPALVPGDTVRIQPMSREREWQQATVDKQIDPRSYEVVTDAGRRLWRNRRFLRKKVARARETVNDGAGEAVTGSLPAIQTPGRPNEEPNEETASDGPMNDAEGESSTVISENPYVTRHGRVVKKPDRLDI